MVAAAAVLTFAVVTGIMMALYQGRAVSAFSLGEDGHKTWVIDPGHGGPDGGAVGADGTVESHINLELGLRLRDLADFLGVPTVLTRDTDVSIHTEGESLREQKRSDLKHRAELASATENALLLSIHENIFEQSKYHGAQTFYTTVPDARSCAETIQANLRQALDPANERVSKAVGEDIYLFKSITCPGVLVECGFLSNPEESRKLQDPGYQKKIVLAISAGVLAWEQE